MKIIIVAGGTGGHIYPGLAVAEEIKLRHPSAEILFLGSSQGMERDIVKRSGYRLLAINSRPMVRKISWAAFTAPFFAFFAFFQSLWLLRKFSPDALLLTGGYASLPVAFAAWVLTIPIYVHEQNVLPGVTNRICARLARKVFLSFEKSLSFIPGIVTGNPVRRQIVEADRGSARKNLGCGASDRVILIMGGSQGSRKINQVTVESLPLLQNAGLKLLHIIGSRDFEMIKPAGVYPFYRRIDYLYNIAEALAAADLVISRAGATAIAEFLVREVPMILIPFPFSAEGHQDLNAAEVRQAGAAMVLADSELSADRLVKLLLGSGLNYKQMKENCKKLARPQAAQEIARAIL